MSLWIYASQFVLPKKTTWCMLLRVFLFLFKVPMQPIQTQRGSIENEKLVNTSFYRNRFALTVLKIFHVKVGDFGILAKKSRKLLCGAWALIFTSSEANKGIFYMGLYGEVFVFFINLAIHENQTCHSHVWKLSGSRLFQYYNNDERGAKWQAEKKTGKRWDMTGWFCEVLVGIDISLGRMYGGLYSWTLWFVLSTDII